MQVGTPFGLTQKEIGFYDDNGYLVMEGFYTHAECDDLIAFFDGYADEKHSAVMNLDRQEPKVKAILTHPKMVAIIEALQRSEVVGVQTQMLFKKAGSPYARQAWRPHQDNSYPQCKPGAYITGNIFFRDVDPENGGMYIYPGSHKLGMLPFKPAESYREDPGDQPGNFTEVPDAFKERRTDLRIKRGGALILHGCVLHGSYPNGSKDRDRPMFSVNYVTKGEQFLKGHSANRIAIPVH